LEVEDTTLVMLQKPIPVQFSFLGGKHVSNKRLKGSIASLSNRSAEVVFDVSVDLLTNLKMRLVRAGDRRGTKDIYGKIISKTGQDNYLTRFTSVPPEVGSFFKAFRLHALIED
jgi:adenylate cyclase